MKWLGTANVITRGLVPMKKKIGISLLILYFFCYWMAKRR